MAYNEWLTCGLYPLAYFLDARLTSTTTALKDEERRFKVQL